MHAPIPEKVTGATADRCQRFDDFEAWGVKCRLG